MQGRVAHERCDVSSAWVELTTLECDYAVHFGMVERLESLLSGRTNRHGYDPDARKALRVQCVGKVAEAAVLKFLGRPVTALKTATFGGADIEPDIEVRALGADWYGLRVRPQDPDWKRVVGVVVPPGHEREPLRIVGWILAADAKRAEWAMAPSGRPPMFAVPQRALRPAVELRSVAAA